MGRQPLSKYNHRWDQIPIPTVRRHTSAASRGWNSKPIHPNRFNFMIQVANLCPPTDSNLITICLAYARQILSLQHLLSEIDFAGFGFYIQSVNMNWRFATIRWYYQGIAITTTFSLICKVITWETLPLPRNCRYHSFSQSIMVTFGFYMQGNNRMWRTAAIRSIGGIGK